MYCLLVGNNHVSDAWHRDDCFIDFYQFNIISSLKSLYLFSISKYKSISHLSLDLEHKFFSTIRFNQLNLNTIS